MSVCDVLLNSFSSSRTIHAAGNLGPSLGKLQSRRSSAIHGLHQPAVIRQPARQSVAVEKDAWTGVPWVEWIVQRRGETLLVLMLGGQKLTRSLDGRSYLHALELAEPDSQARPVTSLS
jgi:hypothetical protein